MGRYIDGQDRTQSVLFPERLDDWVEEDNPVGAVDAVVDALDFSALGFGRAEPAETGRPAYHPATLLKIYIYGYLNRIQPSRRLEREAQRNVELVWLTGRLMPDFKTIADFRRDNGGAIRAACRQFVLLCRGLGLFDEATVAIDGSKFKAVNNRDKNFTERKLQARMEQRLKEAPDGQVSLTDPDARSMATSGRGTGIVGYNVRTAVDTKSHLIVEHEVTNVGHDRTQLGTMAERAQEAVGRPVTVLADRGYFKGEEIVRCEEAGIVPLVPKPQTSNNKAAGLYDKSDFVYDATDDTYRCPAGSKAIRRMTVVENGQTLVKYWSSDCRSRALKPKCTTGLNRRIARWEHEDVLERMQTRLAQRPGAARERRQTVEHCFGTLKAWMGASHFLMRRLTNVRTEISLQVLAYNLKRVIALLGTASLIAAVQA